MNWDQLEGKWKQVKGSVRTRWGKLTDDDLDVIGGQKDQLVGKIQERYGIQKDEAQRQVEDWNRRTTRPLIARNREKQASGSWPLTPAAPKSNPGFRRPRRPGATLRAH